MGTAKEVNGHLPRDNMSEFSITTIALIHDPAMSSQPDIHHGGPPATESREPPSSM